MDKKLNSYLLNAFSTTSEVSTGRTSHEEQNQTATLVANKNESSSSSSSKVPQELAASSGSNKTSLFPNTIYKCGYDQTNFFLSIYPELKGAAIVELKKKGQLYTSQDFLVVGVGGFCMGFGKKKVTSPWFRQHFPGTTISINGEAWVQSNVTWERGFELGLTQDSNQTFIRVYFAAMVLCSYSNEQRSLIFDPSKKPLNTRKRFLIYMASNCVDFREAAFDAMSHIDVVYYGGRCAGNISDHNETAVKQQRGGMHWRMNARVFGQYRFCLVLENTKKDGYVTEKIINAFLGGCVPIYYGTEDVFQLFNIKAFVYYDIENPKPAMDRVRYLNENRSAYNEVLAEPVLA